MKDKIQVEFFGVRGSVPTPLRGADVQEKHRRLLEKFQQGGDLQRSIDEFLAEEAKLIPFTYGGNTSSVAVRFNDQIFGLDMGTGVRVYGDSLLREMFANKTLTVNFFISHVHWDHIQGLPFFAALYMNKYKSKIRNHFHFNGGVEWYEAAQTCIEKQHDYPHFPVTWKEITTNTEEITFNSLADGAEIRPGGDVVVVMGKLNHPQETYGFRFIFPNGKIVVYTTDHEPYNPQYPDPRLLFLIHDADIWITDCQYTQLQYEGVEGGVPRHGWGHSYPEAIAQAAVQGKVKHTLLFHHDPGSNDDRIKMIEQKTAQLITDLGGTSQVTAAWEGLILEP